MTITARRTPELQQVSPVAWRPVLVLATATTAGLLTLSGRYGYHRDELYFRVLAEAPAWGYVDQPPLTPLLARASLEVFGDEVWALRVAPALLAGLLAVLLALLAREFGGGRPAQVIAATGAASATPLVSGHILLTASLDWPLWVLVALLVARALLRGQPRWWPVAGAVVGVALLNKLLVVLLILGLAVGLVSAGPRRVLGTPWPWVGAGVAAVVGAPTIAYQLLNGVPQAEMVSSLTGPAARLLFVPAQALALGPLLVPLWGAGLVALWRWPSLRPVRALAVAYPLTCGVLLVLGGQFYYTVGCLLILFAAGAVAAERWLRSVPAAADRRARLLVRVLVTGVATSAVVALPVVPVGALPLTPLPLMNPAVGDQIGWPVYARQVADAFRTLPPEDRDRAVVIADNYGEAGAIARYGPDLGLPPVVSGHNGWYRLGRPGDEVDVAVVVVQGSGAARFLSDRFADCRPAGVLDSGTGVANEEEGSVIRVCRGPRRPWAEMWPDFRYVGLSTFCEPCRRLDLAGT